MRRLDFNCNHLELFALICISFLLSACGSTSIRNHAFCADKAGNGAHCTNLLTNDSYDYSYEEWAKRRFGQVCTDDDPDKLGETFTDMKAALEKTCSKCNCCVYVNTPVTKLKGTFVDPMVEPTPIQIESDNEYVTDAVNPPAKGDFKVYIDRKKMDRFFNELDTSKLRKRRK